MCAAPKGSAPIRLAVNSPKAGPSWAIDPQSPESSFSEAIPTQSPKSLSRSEQSQNEVLYFDPPSLKINETEGW